MSEAPPPAPLLTGKQRRFLRSLAHHLSPVVSIGRPGLTSGVTQELDRALSDHELIKVKVSRDAPLGADALTPELEKASGGQVVQRIGHTLVVYRPHPEAPRIELPAAAAARPDGERG